MRDVWKKAKEDGVFDASGLGLTDEEVNKILKGARTLAKSRPALEVRTESNRVQNYFSLQLQNWQPFDNLFANLPNVDIFGSQFVQLVLTIFIQNNLDKDCQD